MERKASIFTVTCQTLCSLTSTLVFSHLLIPFSSTHEKHQQ